MKTSKYAPTTPAESLAQSKAEKLRKDKERTTRLLGRLRWKAELLMLSYLKTMEIAQSQAQHHHTLESGATSASIHMYQTTVLRGLMMCRSKQKPCSK